MDMVAVAGFGALLNTGLAASGRATEADAALDPRLRAQLPAADLAAVQDALGHGLQLVYAGMAVVALAGLVPAFLFPRGSARSHAHAE